MRDSPRSHGGEVTITITYEDGLGWKAYRWRAQSGDRVVLSKSYESREQAHHEAREIAPTLFRLIDQPQYDALHELSKVTAWLIRDGEIDRALALNEAVSLETGFK